MMPRLTNVSLDEALSASQNAYEESRTLVRTEAAHFGIHSLDGRYTDITSSDATFLELVRYRQYLPIMRYQCSYC